MILVQFLLAQILTGTLFAKREIAFDGLRKFFSRLAGEKAPRWRY